MTEERANSTLDEKLNSEGTPEPQASTPETPQDLLESLELGKSKVTARAEAAIAGISRCIGPAASNESSQETAIQNSAQTAIQLIEARKSQALVMLTEIVRPELPKPETCDELAYKMLKPITERPPYSLEQAMAERPYTHYSSSGNIFQMLRFGIQSVNFKNKLSEARRDDSEIDQLAKEIGGIREKGTSGQAPDSVCLSKFSPNLSPVTKDLLFLINPKIPVYGDRPEHRTTSGYGSGLKPVEIDGHKIGNEIAYQDEIHAINAVLPEDIRAAVVSKHTNVLNGLKQSVREQAKTYVQQRRNNPKLSEDMVANLRLLADLAADSQVEEGIAKFETDLPSLDYQEICARALLIQRELLQEFVGETELSEPALREAISDRFGISFLQKPN